MESFERFSGTIPVVIRIVPTVVATVIQVNGFVRYAPHFDSSLLGRIVTVSRFVPIDDVSVSEQTDHLPNYPGFYEFHPKRQDSQDEPQSVPPHAT